MIVIDMDGFNENDLLGLVLQRHIESWEQFVEIQSNIPSNLRYMSDNVLMSIKDIIVNSYLYDSNS